MGACGEREGVLSLSLFARAHLMKLCPASSSVIDMPPTINSRSPTIVQVCACKPGGTVPVQIGLDQSIVPISRTETSESDFVPSEPP